MEVVFTLPYPEYSVTKELTNHFKKKHGYSVLIPVSRQQKGYDLMVYNQKTGRSITIQVKSSRTYEGTEPKKQTKNRKYRYNTWFNTFGVGDTPCDFYVLFGLYSKLIGKGVKKLDKSRKVSKWYDVVLLAFSGKEMSKFLKGLRQKKSNKQDSKFGFGFDTPKEIYHNRGQGDKEAPLIKNHLFNVMVSKMLIKLK